MFNPNWRITSIFLVAISLSIGWGIRGNFGHEYGAMLGGVLAAVAAVLVSGREDWRQRIPYVAMFGGLGWAFGGSISYMQVISYTHSGHPPSVLYGFAGVFLIGFLWAAMGGASTAFPLVANREFLTRIFTPILWVFAFWAVWSAPEWGISDQISQQADGYNPTESRHASALYWFDADWAQAFVAMAALCAYDWWNRYVTAKPTSYLNAFLTPFRMVAVLAIFAAVGAGFGWSFQAGCNLVGDVWSRTSIPQPISWSSFERPLAYTDYFDWEEQGKQTTARQDEQIEIYGGDKEAMYADTLTNWPNFFYDIPQHLGWIIGLTTGVLLYFRIFGAFRNGSGLLMYMAIGWLVSFLIFPVALGWRLTPPRADDWAGILGVVVAVVVYCFRRGMIPIAYSAIVSGFIGGVGFSGAVLLKLLMVWPGNKQLADNERVVGMWQSLGLGGDASTIVQAWDHWQRSNWHSFYEQSYGFVNGIAVAVVVALLATRVWRANNTPRLRPWTEYAALAFPLLLVLWLNIRKNILMWIEREVVPAEMTMPWFQNVTLSTTMWFNIMWLALCLAFVLLAIRHATRPIAAIPRNWVGRGQLVYLVFLWAIVIANFERALVGFRDGRLLTEGVIFINAAIATVLVLTLPREGDYAPFVPKLTRTLNYGRVAFLWLIASAIIVYGEYRIVSYLYDDSYAGHAGKQFRFGDDAEWKVNPISKTEAHN